MRTDGLLGRTIPPGLIWALATLLAVLFGHWIQSSAHLNHDVSWIAHSARWLLEGRRFGIDVVDPNPPLAWWLSMPAALLVEFRLLNEPLAIRLVFWAYLLTSTALLFAMLSPPQQRETAAATGWRIAFIGMATLAPAASFGQREYLSVLFAMPYLATAAARLDGAVQIRRTLLVAAGLLAGIAFAIKPYFLAIPLLVEGLLIARLGWRSLLRAESVTIGLTIIGYLALVVALVPQYLEFTIPLMRTIYWAFDAVDFSVVVARYQLVAQPFVYGVLIALLARTWTWQHSVLLLAGAGYSASYFVQAKGFVYHAFPVLMSACVFLGVCIASALHRVWTDRDNLSRPMLFSLFTAMLLLTLPPIRWTFGATVDWYVQYNTTWGKTGLYRNAVIDLVDRYAPTPDRHFFAFSMHLFPGFPTASYSIAEWSGRSATQGILSAYARRDELDDLALRDKVVQAAELQRRMVVDDLERYPPSIVLLERSRIRFGMNGRQFDDLAFYLEDPRFKQIWARYEEQAPLGPLRVFVPRTDGASDR